MQSCCFVIPYFGKFPNYLPLFLRSCQYNPSFNWLIISDCVINCEIPDNIKVLHISFKELVDRIASLFPFPISLRSPYKLCDFKPAYGYIFHEELKEYRSWGFCDMDLIFGNLNNFVSELKLEQYDKIFALGHLTIFKNTDDINRLFMSKVNGEDYYKKVFASDSIFFFDEEGGDTININSIFKMNGKKIWEIDYSMNPKIVPTHFVGTKFDFENRKFVDEDYKDAIYVWSKGTLSRTYKKNNNLINETFPYMHLQSRKMKIDAGVLENDCFQIIPNKFIPLMDYPIEMGNFSSFKRGENLTFHRMEVIYKFRIKPIIKYIIEMISI